MIKRRQRQKRYDDSSSSVKFNGHNHHNQNWTVSFNMTLNRQSKTHVEDVNSTRKDNQIDRRTIDRVLSIGN